MNSCVLILFFCMPINRGIVTMVHGQDWPNYVLLSSWYKDNCELCTTPLFNHLIVDTVTNIRDNMYINLRVNKLLLLLLLFLINKG